MGEAKRRRSMAERSLDGIERMSGHSCGPNPSPLMDAMLELFHEHAAKSPTGYLDSQDMVQALAYHMIQTIRGMPPSYKQKVIDDVCNAIRTLSHTPIKPEQIVVLCEGGEA